MADIITGVGYTSAKDIVVDVINATWNQGLVKQAEYTAKIAAATDETTGFLGTVGTPTVSTGTVAVPTITAPAVNIPADATTSAYDDFTTEYLEIATWLESKFTAFRAAYFPDEGALYTAAEDSLQAALASGSYLPASVQSQIWGDDQARILSDKTRAQDAVIALYAGRRFPLPPDVAASAVLQIEQKAQDELAESSRKIAIMSVEQYRFVIDKALTLRDAAMRDAVAYIGALASGPDVASRLVNIGYDAQSKLISSAAQFYNADAQAKEVISKVNQYNNSTALEAAVKNQVSELAMIESKLKALLAEAQALAQMSTSLFNNVNVQAGVGANRNTSVGYNYGNETTATVTPITDVW